MYQLRLEGTYVTRSGLTEEVVFDFSNDGSCTVTCRTYTPRSEKLKIATVRIPRAEWERFRNFVSDREEYFQLVKLTPIAKSREKATFTPPHDIRLWGSVWRCSCGAEFSNEDDARMHRLNV
jgi:hypothetical protein